MFYRSILLSTVLAFSTTANADDFIADLDPDLEELEEISDSSTAKSNVERRQASFDALDEEDDFEMDLTSVAPAQTIEDPDAELEASTSEGDLLQDTNEPVQSLDTISDLDMDLEEEIEVATQPVDPAAKNLDWSLDLDEDVEISVKKTTTEPEAKSAPEELDFLEE